MRRAPIPLMIGALAAAAGLAAAGSAPVTAQEPPRWAPDVAAARAFAEGRAGSVSFAVRTPARSHGFRTQRVARSASVAKAMLMVAYLNRSDVRSRPLRPAERALLGPMIRRSSNEAANEIFVRVGARGLDRVARAAGMRRWRAGPGGFWGGSRITAADQARFLLRIDARIASRHRAYGMGLLRTIVPSQRWGIGRVVPAGWTLHLKGGWGSGSGEVDHQVALLTRGGDRVALAILTTDNPDMDYGNATLRGVAERLLRGLADSGEQGEVAAGGEAGLP